MVVCHELGYLDAMAAPTSAHFGPGTGPTWLNGVECLGIEPDLFTCEHNGIDNHSCEHNKDASVKCSGIIVFLK